MRPFLICSDKLFASVFTRVITVAHFWSDLNDVRTQEQPTCSHWSRCGFRCQWLCSSHAESGEDNSIPRLVTRLYSNYRDVPGIYREIFIHRGRCLVWSLCKCKAFLFLSMNFIKIDNNTNCCSICKDSILISDCYNWSLLHISFRMGYCLLCKCLLSSAWVK